MCRILIIYHSQDGHTQKMAESVAGGAGSIKGVTVVLKRAAEAGLRDLLECDGLAIGSPEYFGYMAGMVKDFFDRTYQEALGRKEVLKKPYVVFISAGNDGTGALNSIERICTGYRLKKIYDPVVARGEINQETLIRCDELGKTIAAGCKEGIY
ncbi:MAG: NAD(P)H-dependent oxidoreductase [Proteobacteria bacterium]|jgi:multimeric flavodoxin WrbA|nr:NAD(P)H-dependent oxidoreductase [Desulfobacterales bacterium]MBL7101714.1 NAD(P)H-dependent oxidoreductase [Desulfobacteraceae bacterium]MBU0734638.1 NAD(P)H-dependent oxidoreductase [Pseudomonadota bacterium]MBL7172904.1 NAD(P)H-dependent oxidoreductase [Desulfobacteraceae bacterium]MBU0988695.1 NAD(P)H-dependent oxidoreductase [Pseudomonadota bacterium]